MLLKTRTFKVNSFQWQRLILGQRLRLNIFLLIEQIRCWQTIFFFFFYKSLIPELWLLFSLSIVLQNSGSSILLHFKFDANIADKLKSSETLRPADNGRTSGLNTRWNHWNLKACMVADCKREVFVCIWQRRYFNNLM